MRNTSYITECSNNSIYICKQKHILRQTNALASKKLCFLDGANLGDVDLYCEKGDTRRKVRRIIEKRVCQNLYRRNKCASYNDNFGRYNEKHRVANSLKNLYGRYSDSPEYAA